MGTTFKELGDVIEYTNAGSALSSGDVVDLTWGIGVCLADIAASTGTGSLAIAGVHTLAASSSEAFTQLQAIYWDGTELVGSSTGNTPAGYAAAAKAEAGTTADVLVNGNPASREQT